MKHNNYTYKTSSIDMSPFNTSFLSITSSITISYHLITKFSQIIIKPVNLNKCLLSERMYL